MQDLKITIVQCEQDWENKEQNFARIGSLVEGTRDTDLILLPEMFNTGFSMNTNLAEDESGKSIEFLCSLSKKYNCLVGATMMFKSEAGITNRFVIVGSDGVQDYYDKKHLFSLAKENLHFKAGDTRKIIKVKGWSINLQVCYDLRFPVFARNNLTSGYELVIYLANWPQKRSLAWNRLLQARAIENLSYCIGVNRVGVDGNDISYCGDSALYSYDGEMVEKVHNEQKVFTVELNYDRLIDFRRKFPFLNDADKPSV